MSDDELFIASGIDATTGEYLLPPMTAERVDAIARADAPDAERVGALKKANDALTSEHLGLPWDVKPEDLSKAGWGIVYAADEAPGVKDALASLLAMRSEQVNDASRVKVLEHRSRETRQKWLARHGVAAGSIDPTKVPFYLLIVGGLSKIPFTFCRELAVEYAVGLLSFDTPAEYAAYANTVAASERQEIKPRSRQVSFFAPRHALDLSTQLSADILVTPLSKEFPWGEVGCRFESVLGPAATHQALTEVLARQGADAPALVFTAGHGLGFPLGHDLQRAHQGALLCQDWAGPKAGPPERSHYFSAADVPDSANVAGMFAFLFACFGGGTPERDRFKQDTDTEPRRLAAAAFASALPQRLLAHPGGGALGCIAHVDRVWSHSFTERRAGPQLGPFKNALGNLLTSKPIGLALKDFNERFAALSVELSGKLEKIGDGMAVPPEELATLWVQRNDAEGYALFGDPAARLRLEKDG